MIFLEITDKASLVPFVSDAKKAGMLRNIDISKISDDRFPIRIPVNLDSVIKLAGNPIVRKTFGKRIEMTVTSYLEAVV